MKYECISWLCGTEDPKGLTRTQIVWIVLSKEAASSLTDAQQ